MAAVLAEEDVAEVEKVVEVLHARPFLKVVRKVHLIAVLEQNLRHTVEQRANLHSKAHQKVQQQSLTLVLDKQ